MKSSVMRKLIRLIDKDGILLVFSFLLAVIASFTQLYLPVLFGRAIDGMISAGHVDFVLMTSILKQALVCIVISALSSFVMTLLNNRIAYDTVKRLRSKAMHAMANLPLKYLDNQKSGDIAARIIADADAVSDGLLLGFSQLFTGVVTIVLTLVFMFTTSWMVTIAVIVMTPLSFFVAKFISTHTYTMFSMQSKTRGKLTAYGDEMTSGMLEVQAFGYHDRAADTFRRMNEELKEYAVKGTFYSSLTNPSTRCVNSIVYACVALLGAWLILAGSLTVGGLSILLNYANQYMKPFNDITSVITELQNAFACAKRLFDLIDETPEQDPVYAQVQKPDIHDVKGEITIEHMDFSYVKDVPFIRDFNLYVRPGMHVALVGPTGCGKTTLINLLMRFYETDGGRILLDGQDITSINRHSLRSCFGMVLQDTWLSSGTIRDNLTMGNQEATDDEIREACERTQCLEWIEQMEKGLDTLIHEDRLSAGQKQLLCITRVMLAKPQILILDEATSSIDTRTEILVQKAFDELMKGRTSFVVAHRLSTIRNADLILVMKDGTIIERGNHDELMAQKGFYEHLFNSQFATAESH
ncbi:MAG: ABC transporter ATP-binding protein [Bulleidia sp.]